MLTWAAPRKLTSGQGAKPVLVMMKTPSGGVDVADSLAADQVDATGAGDAFTVGLLHGLLQGDDMATALQAGAAWGAATVAQLRSIPVPWEELAGPFH